MYYVYIYVYYIHNIYFKGFNGKNFIGGALIVLYWVFFEIKILCRDLKDVLDA